MAAAQLLEHNPHPDLAEIREGLAGNLCRCTGFMRIFESVLAAAGAQAAEPAAERGAPCAVMRQMHDLIAPGSLAAVLDLLAAEPGAWTPIAGGTELMVALRRRPAQRAKAGEPVGHSRSALHRNQS